MESMFKYLSFSDSTQKKKEEINDEQEEPLTEEESLFEFKKALQAVPGLNVSTEADYLLRFLRVKSFSIPSAVKTYQSTEVWRKRHEEFLNIPLHDCLPIFKMGFFTIFREKHEGATIIHMSAYKWEPDGLDMAWEKTSRTLIYLIDEIQLVPANQKNGIVIICDLGNTSASKMMTIVSYFTIKNIKLLFGYITGGQPTRLKSVHGLSTPFIVANVYNAVKYLLKKKMRDRVFAHYGDYRVLNKHIAKDSLPQYLGGTIPDELNVDTEVMKSLFQRHNIINNNQ